MKLHKTLAIERIEHINPLYFVLSIRDKELAELSRPGQFCQIRPLSLTLPRLRKPISIYDVDGDLLRLMIKRIGEGTQSLSKLQSGDTIDLIGPLGQGFSIPQNNRAVLISGGIGYPPLFFVLKRLKDSGNETYWLHGGNCSDDLFPCDELWLLHGRSLSVDPNSSTVGQLHKRSLSVDPNTGTAGQLHKRSLSEDARSGLVSDGLILRLQDHHYDIAYACGPIPMLKVCHQICQAAGIPLQVSMEAYMACGIGVCHGCAIPMWERGKPVYRNVCSDGPVFDADAIRWEEL